MDATHTLQDMMDMKLRERHVKTDLSGDMVKAKGWSCYLTVWCCPIQWHKRREMSERQKKR